MVLIRAVQTTSTRDIEMYQDVEAESDDGLAGDDYQLSTLWASGRLKVMPHCSSGCCET